MIENSNPEGDGLKASLGRLSERRVLDRVSGEISDSLGEEQVSQFYGEGRKNSCGLRLRGDRLACSSHLRCIERKPATTTEKHNVINS